MLLVEYGEPINVALTEQEAEKLRTASSNWRKKLRLKYSPISLKRINLGKYKIRAKGIAGFISIDNIHIEIVPKFLFEGLDRDDWKTSMWRFLSYGKGFNLFENTLLGISHDKGISDLLAELFLSSLKGAEEIGYAVSYKEASIQHDNVIGKLDPDYYDQLIPVTGSLNLLADELSYDNEINQMLKWAGLQLASNVESSDLRKRLRLWTEELSGVSNTKPNNLISPQRLNNYSHLKQAIEIAELLLEDINVNFSQDFANVPGFLWDSDALFERAMFRLFKEVLRKVDSRAIKKSLLLAHSPEGIKVTTIPDILFYKNNQPIFLADSKYKIYNKRPAPEDFYQVMSGASLLNLSCATLIYPAMGDDFHVDYFDLEHDQKPQRIYIFKIGLECFKSNSSLKKLKLKLERWLEENIEFH